MRCFVVSSHIRGYTPDYIQIFLLLENWFSVVSFFFGWGEGGGGGPEAPLFSIKYLQSLYLPHLNNGSDLSILIYREVPT